MIRTVLLATDGSDTARRAARLAEEIALCSHARVTVLSVAQPIPYDTLGPAYPGYLDDIEAIAKEIAAEQARELQRAGVEAEPRVAVSSLVDESIVETAESIGADLVVMGTHGRSGLSRAILGSVADRVARRGDVPLLLAKKDGD